MPSRIDTTWKEEGRPAAAQQFFSESVMEGQRMQVVNSVQEEERTPLYPHQVESTQETESMEYEFMPCATTVPASL